MKVTKNAKMLALLDGFIFIRKDTLIRLISQNTDANENDARAIVETAITHDKRQIERTAKAKPRVFKRRA